MRRLEIDGELLVEGEGLAARLTGDGTTVRAVVTGRLGGADAARRRRVAGLARRLEAAGVQVVATDASGRRLGEAGAAVRSPLGRLTVGAAQVRPSARLLLRALARRSPGAAIMER